MAYTNRIHTIYERRSNTHACCAMSMVCKNCGTPLEDGAERCFICGAVQEVKSEPTVEPAVEPTVEPVTEPVASADAPASENSAVVIPPALFDTPDFSEPQPKMKRKLKKIIIPIVALISAAAVLLCVLNWGWITKAFLDLFGSDQALRDKVVEEQTEQIADGLSNQYGDTLDNLKGILAGDKYITTKMELVVSDEVEDLVADYEDLIIDFLGDDFKDVEDLVKLLDGSYVTIAGGGTVEDLRAAIRLGINHKEVLSAGAVANLVEETLVASVPVLSEYKLDLSEELADALYGMDSIESIEMALAVLDAMPSQETVNALINKYVSLALAEFDDVSKEKDTLKIGGIKEKVTVMETELTASDLLDVCASVLEEMKTDDEVETIIIDMAETLNEAGLLMADPDDLYEDFQDELDYMVEDLEEQADDIDDDVDILWTQYLNSNYETIGMALEVDGDEVLYYATATEGKEFATEMEIAGYEFITGEGTIEKGIVNGTYELDSDTLSSLFYFYGLDDMSIKIKVRDFDTNAAQNGDIKGSFELVLDDELIQELMDAAGMPGYIGTAATSMFDLGIRLDIDTVGDSDSLQLSVSDSGAVLVGIKLTTTISDKEVDVPMASGEALDPYEWEDTVSPDELLEALMDAGIPEEWLEMIAYYA